MFIAACSTQQPDLLADARMSSTPDAATTTTTPDAARTTTTADATTPTIDAATTTPTIDAAANNTLDAHAAVPLVVITSGPSGTIEDPSPTIEFTASENPTSIECQEDNGSRVSCTSPFTVSAFSAGSHTITVYGTNANGTGSAQAAFAVLLPDWTTITPSSGPGIRDAMTTAYDSKRGVTVFFGGQQSGANNNFTDTWEWDGTTWTQQFPVHSPPARVEAAMVYDEAHDVTLLFGGDFQGAYFNDTWQWDGIDWTQLAPANSPTGRFAPGMAYDSATGTTLLFGGFPSNAVYLNDTWRWDGSNWTQLSTAHSPAGRFECAMAYDALHSQFVMYGGHATDQSIGQTWIFDGSDWSQVAGAAVVSQYFAGEAAYDTATQRIMMINGYATAEWDGSTWITINTQTGSHSLIYPGLVYDIKQDKLIAIDGYDEVSTTVTSNIWTYGL